MDTTVLEAARQRWTGVAAELVHLRDEVRSLESVGWQSTAAGAYRERLLRELAALDRLEQQAMDLIGAYHTHIAVVRALPDGGILGIGK